MEIFIKFYLVYLYLPVDEPRVDFGDIQPSHDLCKKRSGRRAVGFSFPPTPNIEDIE